MAKNVEINIEINTSDGVKSLGQLNKETTTTLKTLKEMEEASELLNEKLKNVEVGTKEYKELKKELIKVNTEIKNQELAMESLDNEQVASELKSVAGGFMDMAGGMALVGASNKSLEKVVQTMAQVEGATKIVTGAMESYSSMVKLSHTITTGFSVAMKAVANSSVIMAVKTKVAAAAQWLLNAAMTANPIGLIIAGIALLIGGIVALIVNIKKVITWFKSMAKYALLLLGPIGLIIVAFTSLGKTQESEAEKEARREKERIEAYEKRIEAIEEIISAERKSGAERARLFKNEIERLSALGKATDKIRRESLVDAVNTSKEILANEEKLTGETIKEYNRRLGTNFKTEDEITAYLKKSIEERQGVLWAADEEEIKILNSRAKNNKAAIEELRVAEINLESDKTKAREESQKKYLAMLEARKKAEEELIKAETEGWLKYEEMRIEMMFDGIEKELALNQFRYEQATKDLNDNLESNRQIRLLEEEKTLQKEWEIRQKYAKLNEKKAVQIAINTEKKIASESSIIRDETMAERVGAWQTANAEIIGKIQEGFQVASDAISGIMEATQQILSQQAEQKSSEREQQYSKEAEELKASLANREIDQKQFENKMALLEQKRDQKEMQAKRKAFKQQKAMQIVSAIMNTAQAVIAGLSAPFPLGIVQAAINGAMGAAQIGIIASQKFKAARGGVVPGAPSGIDSVDAILAPGEAVINAQSASMFPQTLSAINQAGGGISLAPEIPNTSSNSKPIFRDNEKPQIIKAYVVETDVTEKQRRVSRIERSAQVG